MSFTDWMVGGPFLRQIHALADCSSWVLQLGLHPSLDLWQRISCCGTRWMSPSPSGATSSDFHVHIDNFSSLLLGHLLPGQASKFYFFYSGLGLPIDVPSPSFSATGLPHHTLTSCFSYSSYLKYLCHHLPHRHYPRHRSRHCHCLSSVYA
jgi:hypothetical protein